MYILKASIRVRNKRKRTTGFIVDNNYIKYYDALQNINLIDNLFTTKDGVIKSKNKALKEIDVDKINKSIYKNRCKETPLIMDVLLLIFLIVSPHAFTITKGISAITPTK